jgi:hypothetical protein
MRMIAEEGCGVVLYLHNTSRGFEIDHSGFGRRFRLPVAQPAAIGRHQRGLSCIRNCVRAKARRPAAAAFCAPSASVARFCPTWASSASGCCQIRRCTFRPWKAFGLEIVEQVAIPIEDEKPSY